MSKIGAAKSKLSYSVNFLTRITSQVDQSYLQPYAPKSTPEAQHRSLSRRVARMKSAKLTIETALDKLLERFDAVYRDVAAFEDPESATAEVDKHWEQIKGNTIINETRQLLSKLDAQIDADDLLLDQLQDQINTVPPLANASSREQLNLNATLNAPNDNLAHSASSVAAAKSPHQNADSIASNADDCAVQLRKIELPTFDGDPAQFYDFWAKFKATVHNNPSLTLANKFLHLVNCLKGAAATYIEAYDITDPRNYDRAIEELLNRYDRPEFTHNYYLQKLEQISPSDGSASSQRITLSRIRACILQLQRFEDPNNSLALKNMVRRKFPRETQLEVIKMENRQSGKVWNLHELLEGFDKHIAELEKIDDRTLYLNTAEDQSVHSQSADEDDVDTRPSTPQPPYNPDICCFCGSANHVSTCCPIPSLPSSRRYVVDCLQLCYKCLAKGHVASSCTAANCNRCGRAHHPLLCLTNPIPRSSSVGRSSSNTCEPRDYRGSSRSRHTIRDSSRERRHYSRRSHSYDSSCSPRRSRSHDRVSHRSSRYYSPSPNRSSHRHHSPYHRRYHSYRRSSPYPSRSPPVVRFSDSTYGSPSRRRSSRSPSRSPSMSPSRSRSHSHAVSASPTEYQQVIDCLPSVNDEKVRTSLGPYKTVLMIVRGYIQHGITRELEPIHMLLDSGAQMSFITDDAVDRLCLNAHNRRPLTLVGFGDHRSKEISGFLDVELFNKYG
ncbi:zinc knuckle [Oesophagostomum dentatum]|uniref:Zinc knuckle n=1 Tax=Oesophagostomum dentatum TaxID=61180 RepID=A0A0B1SQK0_OESDE|nr:zinc knuckle [Oesophagostomum dentatum]